MAVKAKAVTQADVDRERYEREAAEARRERDQRLAATDWTQVRDTPVDPNAWESYRQALRDVPGQKGFPFRVTWPEEPIDETTNNS